MYCENSSALGGNLPTYGECFGPASHRRDLINSKKALHVLVSTNITLALREKF